MTRTTVLVVSLFSALAGCGSSTPASGTTSAQGGGATGTGTSAQPAETVALSAEAQIFEVVLDELDIEVSAPPSQPDAPGLRYVQLWVRETPREPHGLAADGTPIGADAHVSAEEARAILALLDREGFFARAARHHSPRVASPSTAPPSGSSVAPGPEAASGTLRVVVRGRAGEEWHLSASEDQPLDGAARSRLDAIIAAVGGDAQRELRALEDARLPR